MHYFHGARRKLIARTLVTRDVTGNLLHRIHRGGKRNALELTGHGGDTLYTGHQVGAAFLIDHGVDLIENDRVYVIQETFAACGREQNIEAFGRRNEYFGGVPQHSPAHGRIGVAASRCYRHGWEVFAAAFDRCPQLAQRREQVAFDMALKKTEN